MDRLITLLQNLLSLNKVASVSLPGVFSALAIAILMWPPRTIDEVPCVIIPGQIQIANVPACRPTANEQRTRACMLGTRDLPNRPWFEPEASKNSQLVLDREKQNIAECVENETSRKGEEKARNEYLTQDVADRQKLSTVLLDTYTAYEKSNNPLAGQFRAKWESNSKAIGDIREKILSNEQSIRDRDRNLTELARFDKIISERLADPGRLRPRQTFDDVLIALVNHVTGFILLAIALGVVSTPLAQAGAAGFFDLVFREGF